jgi:hypothetical protein
VWGNVYCHDGGRERRLVGTNQIPFFCAHVLNLAPSLRTAASWPVHGSCWPCKKRSGELGLWWMRTWKLWREWLRRRGRGELRAVL